MVSVLSYGGGVNSTAMLLLLQERGVHPDLALFADTGGELPGTYAHIALMRQWCQDHGIRFEVVSNGSPAKGATLEENCLKRKELPSLAYGFKGCSTKWKRQPMDRFIRDEFPPAQEAWARGELVIRYIGIDAGEERRRKLPPDARYRYVYPLVEAGIDRDGCLDLIKKHGLPVPPKSSCFFCPAMRKEEIVKLAADHPDLMQRAIDIERNAQTHTVAGLGRQFRWEDLVEMDRRQGRLFPDFPPPPPCDCTDGDDE